MKPRISYADAAEILGVHISAIPKMIRRGELHSHRRRGASLDRVEVEALAERRRLAREFFVPKKRRRRPIEGWPDLEHVWLKPAQVATLLDVSEQGVTKMVRRGRLPAAHRGSRWWIRQDQLERAVDARLATWTRRA